MNELKNDINLREAVNRREQQLPPLPDGLNEKLMESLPLIPPEGKEMKRKWVSIPWGGIKGGLLIAAAASISLFFVFHTGQKESPQEPLVAQQMVKPAAVPSQPIVDKSQPEVVADEQPEEKPVTERSEDAHQATEPTSTENVKATSHFNSQPSLGFTSTEDEPFFLASTSYMGTHRSYRDGLAASESEDGSDIQLSTKAASQDRPQIPQIPHRKYTKKERKQVAVLGAIATKRWHIDISSMNTMRYGSSTVTTDFYLELRGDTLRSYLPYLGDAQTPTLSPAIGLNFEEPVLNYKESKSNSNKYTQIDIDVKTREDSYHYVIEIYDNGQAYIRVRSMKRDPISFDGTMDTSN